MSVRASTIRAARLFGRHVWQRAEDCAGLRVRQQSRRPCSSRPVSGALLRQFGQSEIEHLDVAIAADHEIVRFDVTTASVLWAKRACSV